MVDLSVAENASVIAVQDVPRSDGELRHRPAPSLQGRHGAIEAIVENQQTGARPRVVGALCAEHAHFGLPRPA